MTAPQTLAPEAGSVAPDVELPDEHGTLHRLSEQRGRWTVVYFYHEDDTPGGTVEARQLRDLDSAIRVAGGDVWGVSPAGPASHRRYREKFGVPFTLLSDPDHRLAEAYGAWQLKTLYGRKYWGIQRSSFLIDPEGRIARAWPKVKADGHAAEVLTALAEARAARA